MLHHASYIVTFNWLNKQHLVELNFNFCVISIYFIGLNSSIIIYIIVVTYTVADLGGGGGGGG